MPGFGGRQLSLFESDLKPLFFRYGRNKSWPAKTLARRGSTALASQNWCSHKYEKQVVLPATYAIKLFHVNLMSRNVICVILYLLSSIIHSFRATCFKAKATARYHGDFCVVVRPQFLGRLDFITSLSRDFPDDGQKPWPGQGIFLP